jgi:hypothetical protein
VQKACATFCAADQRTTFLVGSNPRTFEDALLECFSPSHQTHLILPYKHPYKVRYPYSVRIPFLASPRWPDKPSDTTCRTVQ